MINKNEFMKKIKKNRFIVLIISVIVVTGVYYGVDKAIDSYVFKNNTNIEDEAEIEGKTKEENVSKSESAEKKNWFEILFGGSDEEVDEMDKWETLENGAEGSSTGESTSGKIPETEVDFELEGIEEGKDVIVEVSGQEQDRGQELFGEQQSQELKEKIYIYITGEVNIPGVVILDKGSRIVDAINSAGGTTAKADISKVNLVYVLEDGMKVNIPNFNELKNNHKFEYITISSGEGASDIDDRNMPNEGSYNSYASSSSNYGVVNINTATQTELESLPGIGPSLALKIINYRKENGNFSSIEQIKEVSGIGESKFENFKKYIKI